MTPQTLLTSVSPLDLDSGQAVIIPQEDPLRTDRTSTIAWSCQIHFNVTRNSFSELIVKLI